ncbi:MAG: serine hydrolase [Prolixibacteraceae bacterium]|jgi:CubicO group peptidase (beta-lactamase class C family)|nr:serine hydrolase [Prolixibacteraceae bacterium]MBT6998489.1 serine hydrolase [Prolixibacteraceae bacterium]MBT7397130.1 serine hydrolase [Prolixibacteraceae bacterium]
MKKYLILPFLLISLTLVAQNVDLEKLDSYIEKTAKEWGIPGMSVGIVQDGEIVFSKGYGVLEVSKTEKPDGNTLYAIASNTKAFTSATIAMLVQEGKLNWEDKVQKHLPYFELFSPFISQETTIRDLLCHRVGLGTFSGDVIWYKSDLTSEEIIKRLKYLPSAFNFRDGFGYSNVMYITAGEVIKTVTGKTWGENVQDRILDPVNMDRTIYSLKKLESKGNFATPHALENEKNIPIPYVNWEEVAALGGIISSVNDIGKWMIFNMNHGIIGNDTLLTSSSRNMIWKLHNSYTVDHTKTDDFNTHFRGYGLGWGLADFHGRLRVSHGGGYDGMISSVNMIPDEKLGIVVLTNGMKAPTTAVTNYVLNAFLGEEEKDWSAEMLERRNKSDGGDKRISERKEKRVTGTRPSLELGKYAGTYNSDIYGKIEVKMENDKLRIYFEHTPDLLATLEHWHYDVWKINWDKTHAWFNFGTVKFNTTNNLEITGMDFDVPNNDIFFEELKPKRVN